MPRIYHDEHNEFGERALVWIVCDGCGKRAKPGDPEMLDSDQIKGLIPFTPGLTRVVSQAGEGKSQLLWHWIKSGGPEWRDVYFVDPEGTYSGAPEDVPARALVNYDTDAQIDRLMEEVSSGGILVIDHAERVQCDNLTDSAFTAPLALGHFLARLGFVAKRRGIMVVAAIQLRRLGAPEGIRVYSPEET